MLSSSSSSPSQLSSSSVVSTRRWPCAKGSTRRRTAVEEDDDFFGCGGGEVEPDVIGGDGHEVVAAIDQDGEFDLGGAAVIKELVEGGFDGATGEENVVDKNDAGAVDVGRQNGGRKFFRDGIAADVVAVKRDVDGA